MINLRFGKLSALAALFVGGATIAAVACGGEAAATPKPQVVIQTVVVEKPVEKIVEKTVIVEKAVEKIVEKIVQQTVIVEKPVEKIVEKVVVQTATPTSVPSATPLPAQAKQAGTSVIGERFIRPDIFLPSKQSSGDDFQYALYGVYEYLIKTDKVELPGYGAPNNKGILYDWVIDTNLSKVTFKVRKGDAFHGGWGGNRPLNRPSRLSS